MRLHEPERHIPATDAAWDPGRVRAWLRRYASDALAERAERPWPMHPLDGEGAEGGPFHGLYLGACGVWLALARLAAEGYCALPRGLGDIFEEVLTDYGRAPDTGACVPSWFLGESGVLTACCLVRPSDERLDRLAGAIRGNRDNPTCELLWGAPGTMIAALCMVEATGDERWAELYRDSAAVLWERWTADEVWGTWAWRQDLYGQRACYVGAGHGWAGNLHALWRGQEFLKEEQRDVLRARTLAGLERFAMVEGELANWPPEPGVTRKMLVQWCHGAPGVITALRHADVPEALPLLTRGARLIAAAGPLAKGAGLCHGTAGNGAALLEMYRRTGHAEWLTRAREFAMTAVDQSEAHFERYGAWRHSLWTGDPGLAWFLLDCLAGVCSGLPGLDVLGLVP